LCSCVRFFGDQRFDLLGSADKVPPRALGLFDGVIALSALAQSIGGPFRRGQRMQLALGIEVRDLGNLDAVAAQVVRASVQGLFVGVSPFFLSARTEITAMAARLKLPAMFSWREFTDAGGLMSYGSNLPDLYRTAARLVDRILKGAKPGDLPFEIPTRYELIVNLKTAKAMGLNISDSFLLLADEVIE
jgi:putative tryptophan/tyrosine transport system substrate-binding protein